MSRSRTQFLAIPAGEPRPRKHEAWQKSPAHHAGSRRFRHMRTLNALCYAKALAISGNASEARTIYQRLFTVWKDADPNVPILKDARSDFAQLTALSINQR